jgi:Dpy-30 motif/Nucleoside diphosphate kinase
MVQAVLRKCASRQYNVVRTEQRAHVAGTCVHLDRQNAVRSRGASRAHGIANNGRQSYADGTRNATHGSDSPASAAREFQFFFPHRGPAPQHEPVEAAMSAALEATLCKGLTQLAREKPSGDPLEAVKWLGAWLLENNPNNPKSVAPKGMSLDDVDDGSGFEPWVKQMQADQQANAQAVASATQ